MDVAGVLEYNRTFVDGLLNSSSIIRITQLDLPLVMFGNTSQTVWLRYIPPQDLPSMARSCNSESAIVDLVNMTTFNADALKNPAFETVVVQFAVVCDRRVCLPGQQRVSSHAGMVTN